MPKTSDVIRTSMMPKNARRSHSLASTTTDKTNGNKGAMTPDRDESIPQGQTLTQPNSIGTGTGEPQTRKQGKGAQQPFPSTPRSGTSTPESKPKVHLTGAEGLIWDIQGTFDSNLSMPTSRSNDPIHGCAKLEYLYLLYGLRCEEVETGP